MAKDDSESLASCEASTDSEELKVEEKKREEEKVDKGEEGRRGGMYGTPGKIFGPRVVSGKFQTGAGAWARASLNQTWPRGSRRQVEKEIFRKVRKKTGKMRRERRKGKGKGKEKGKSKGKGRKGSDR